MPKWSETRVGEVEVLEDELPDRDLRPGAVVVDLDDRIPVEAVPPLRGMEERVGVADVRLREPDQPGQDAGTGVGCQPDRRWPSRSALDLTL